jgi:hypothetical protein
MRCISLRTVPAAIDPSRPIYNKPEFAMSRNYAGIYTASHQQRKNCPRAIFARCQASVNIRRRLH